jgi:hypothetical protein
MSGLTAALPDIFNVSEMVAKLGQKKFSVVEARM